MAERYFINKYYLVRSFKEQFGVSVMDYLLRVRITKAKNLLRFSKMSAEEIGLITGIGDQYYFSRFLRRLKVLVYERIGRAGGITYLVLLLPYRISLAIGILFITAMIIVANATVQISDAMKFCKYPNTSSYLPFI